LDLTLVKIASPEGHKGGDMRPRDSEPTGVYSNLRAVLRRVKTRIDPVSHSDLSSIEIAHNSSEIPYSETHVCGWDVTMDSFIRCEM